MHPTGTTEAAMLSQIRASWTEHGVWGFDKQRCTHCVDVVSAWGRLYYGCWVWPRVNPPQVRGQRNGDWGRGIQ